MIIKDETQAVVRAAAILHAAYHEIENPDPDFSSADAVLAERTPNYGGAWRKVDGEEVLVRRADPADVREWHRLYAIVTELAESMAPPELDGDRHCACGVRLRSRQEEFCSKRCSTIARLRS
jgi:hypothetical protein